MTKAKEQRVAREWTLRFDDNEMRSEIWTRGPYYSADNNIEFVDVREILPDLTKSIKSQGDGVEIGGPKSAAEKLEAQGPHNCPLEGHFSPDGRSWQMCNSESPPSAPVLMVIGEIYEHPECQRQANEYVAKWWKEPLVQSRANFDFRVGFEAGAKWHQQTYASKDTAGAKTESLAGNTTEIPDASNMLGLIGEREKLQMRIQEDAKLACTYMEANTMLNHLLDEKNKRIQELEAENAELKRTISQLKEKDAELKGKE